MDLGEAGAAVSWGREAADEGWRCGSRNLGAFSRDRSTEAQGRRRVFPSVPCFPAGVVSSRSRSPGEGMRGCAIEVARDDGVRWEREPRRIVAWTRFACIRGNTRRGEKEQEIMCGAGLRGRNGRGWCASLRATPWSASNSARTYDQKAGHNKA